MKIVLILGAGSSVAEASSYRRERTFEHPPLDADFFDKATALGSRRAQLRTSIRALKARAEETDRFYDPFNEKGTALEQYFADVYYEVASTRSPQAFAVYVALLRLYAGTLAATTNWMASVGRPAGVVGRLLRKELKRAESEKLTVITFNHDLVIENEVARLPHLGNKWCLSSLYADLDLNLLTAPGNAARFPQHHRDCPHNSPITLLKLHGSLNWVVRQLGRDPAISTLFPTPSQQRTIYLHDARATSTLTGEITMSSPGRGRKRWYGFPVIVPPIYDKQSITGMGIFQRVWQAAGEAIEEADSLVLVGYSLPEADVVARQMIRRAFSASSLTSVDCVNPDPGIVSKLQSVLGCPVSRLYVDLETYLAEGP